MIKPALRFFINSNFFLLFLLLTPALLPVAHGALGQPCTIENLDPVCDTCNGELCHNFGTVQEPNLLCGAAQINGFVGENPTFLFNLVPSYLGPQCPGGPLLDMAQKATQTANSSLAGCWNICTPTVIETNLQNLGYFNFLGPVCEPDPNFCQNISGGAQSNDCRTGVCTSDPIIDFDNPSGCDYTLVPDSEDFTCTLCTNEEELDISSCGNGICEVGQGEDCLICPVDCVIPGFEDTCPLTSGAVIEDACDDSFPGKRTMFAGPPYNRDRSQECEDGDLCTDNQCSTDHLSCESTPKACSMDLSDFCCPANCQAPADGATSCDNATDCDIDCFASKECVAPSPTPRPFSDLCVSGSGFGGGDGSAGSCATCSLNKTGSYLPGGLSTFIGMGLILTGLFVSLRRKPRVLDID